MSYSTKSYAAETLASYPPGTVSYQTSSTFITGYPLLHIRDDETTTSTSKSRSRTVSHTSTTSGPCTNKQLCQTSANTTPLTIGLSVGLPIFVFALIIGVFAFRNYRKGKKEEENDDDPDFYGETTILPDYPSHPGPRFGGPNSSQFDMSYPPNSASHHDNGSYYSNPFQGESSRYPPSAAITQRYDNASINQSLNQPDTKYGSFSLPYQQNMGSKQSLDAFAKEIGSEYTAYQLGTPTSRPSSRGASRNTSRQTSPHRGSPVRDNQSLTDSFSYKKNTVVAGGDIGSALKSVATNEDLEAHRADPNLTVTTSVSNDRDLTTSGTANTPLTREDGDSFTVGSEDDDVFKDSYADPQHSQVSTEETTAHKRNVSEFSYISNDPEVIQHEEPLNRNEESPLKTNINLDEHILPVSEDERFQFEKSDAPVKTVKYEALNDTEERAAADGEEEDENVKRIKSVYRIYFDRENSIRSKRNTMGGLEDGEEAPPLPQIDSSYIENHGIESQESADEPPIAESSHLTVDTAAKGRGHRVVSSIYSTIPLAKFDNNGDPVQPEQHQNQNQQMYLPQEQQPQQQQQPQQHQYHQPQTQQEQYYDQQQYQQHYDPQYAAASQYPYQPYPSQSPPMNQQPYFIPQPVEPMVPAQNIPNPTKIGYDSVISNPIYAPKKSLTSAARPQIEVKPFNPLHYSDKIFPPTSPVIPSSPSFSNSGSQFELSQQTTAAPSPHHIRQSIVMIDPVEIGAAKLYRPAGSFTRELNSANSSRSGSLSSQSGIRGAFYNPDGSRNEVLPRAGSQMDLRKQLGSSDNYNF